MSQLSKRVRELRLGRNMTQRELSDMLGLTPKMVSFYELDERTPPLDILEKLADIFNVSTDYLVGRTDTPEQSAPEKVEFDELEFALLGEMRELDADDKEELLRDAKRLREIKELRKLKGSIEE